MTTLYIIVSALSGLDIVVGSGKLRHEDCECFDQTRKRHTWTFDVMIFLDIGSYVSDTQIIISAHQFPWLYGRYLWCDYFKFTSTRLLGSVINLRMLVMNLTIYQLLLKFQRLEFQQSVISKIRRHTSLASVATSRLAYTKLKFFRCCRRGINED